MIFGFNTDVKHGDTIYHVQSEARESERLLQTQVFVRGRCIGKKAVPYGDPAGNQLRDQQPPDHQKLDQQSPDQPSVDQQQLDQQRLGQQRLDQQRLDQQKEQQLRDQHRGVLEAIKEGKLDQVLDRAEPDTLAAVRHLDVQWENSDSVHANRTLTIRLRVTEDGRPVPAARLTLRFTRAAAAPFFTQAIGDSAGQAEFALEVDDTELADSSIMVQATHEGRSVTRKFVLHKTA